MNDVANSKSNDMLHLGAQGELKLPRSLCRTLGWKEGETLLARVVCEGTLQLETLGNSIRKACGLLRPLSGDRRLVDELLEDRKREVAHG